MQVQQLAILITIIIAICALQNFKNTVLMWTVAQTLLNPQVAVRYESPAMSCILAADIMLLLIYFAKKKRLKRRKIYRERYLLHIPMMAMLSSYIMSLLFSPLTSMTGINSGIKYFISNFGILFLFQICLNDIDDIKLFIKTAAAIALMQTGLSLIEIIFQDNYWLDFVYYNSPQNEVTRGRMFYTPPEIAGAFSTRYGMIRSKAFFQIHIYFGFYCLIYFYLFIRNYIKKWNIISKKNLLLCIILLSCGVLMANSKTGYVGLVVMLFAVFRPSKLLKLKYFTYFIIFISALILFFPGYMMNYLSLFDDSIAEEGGGSTIALREMQFETAYLLFIRNPLFGNGLGSTALLAPHGFSDILGSESSWMQIMPERGLWGAMMYIIMYLSIYHTFKKSFGLRALFFYLLSVFVMETATGQLDLFIWGVPLILIYKYRRILRRENSVYSQEMIKSNLTI